MIFEFMSIFLQTMVYDKSLRLSSYSISGGSMTVGQITNHMSVDAYNMFFFSQRMHYLWAVPFRVSKQTETYFWSDTARSTSHEFWPNVQIMQV